MVDYVGKLFGHIKKVLDYIQKNENVILWGPWRHFFSCRSDMI